MARITVDEQWYVKLTPEEAYTAICVGGRRELKAIHEMRKDRQKWKKPRQGFQQHIEGAAAELAVAKHYNRYWSGLPLDTWSLPDVGFELEVKLRTDWEEYPDLNIKVTDKDEKKYLLVHGKIPNYWLIGWCFGHEFPRGNKSSVWVAPEQLHAMDTLVLERP